MVRVLLASAFLFIPAISLAEPHTPGVHDRAPRIHDRAPRPHDIHVPHTA